MNKKKFKKNKKVGRKSTFEKNKKKYIEEIEKYAYKGTPNKEIAKNVFGIGESTFYEWLEKYPELEQAFNKGKEKKENEEREKGLSLAEEKLKALVEGYVYEEIEEIQDMKIDENERDKPKILHVRKIKRKKTIQPNVTAVIFTLCNLGFPKWRNIQKVEHSGFLTNNNLNIAYEDYKNMTNEELLKRQKEIINDIGK